MGGAIPNALRNTNPHMQDRALSGPVNYKQIPELAERGQIQIDTFLDFAKVVGKRITEAHPNVQRWRAALAERPSFNL